MQDATAVRKFPTTISSLIFAVMALYTCLHWYSPHGATRMRDFITPYNASRCLWRDCDPYNPDQIQQEFTLAGGLPVDHPLWSWEPPVYPPSALIEMLPVSFLPFQAARITWYASTAIFCCGALLVLTRFFTPRYRPWALLLAAWTLASEPLASTLYCGQPTGIAVSLALFAFWFFSRDRNNAGVLCLGLSMGLKPQLAGLIFIALLLDPRRRWVAIKSGVVAAVLLAVGIAWLSLEPASNHWRENYHRQVENSLSPGAVNDPSASSAFAFNFTNLQSASSLFISSANRNNELAYALGGSIFLAWLYLTLAARSSEDSRAISLAAIVCIGLVPVYHRHYDLVLLIFSFQALFLLVRRSRLGWPALICTLFLLVPPQGLSRWQSLAYTPHLWLEKLSPGWRLLFFQRERPLVLIALSVIYIAALPVLARKPASLVAASAGSQSSFPLGVCE